MRCIATYTSGKPVVFAYLCLTETLLRPEEGGGVPEL